MPGRPQNVSTRIPARCARDLLTVAEVARLASVSQRTVWYDIAARRLPAVRKDGLTRVDVVNVLRGGVVKPGEYERGSWRYRIHTIRIWVVVAFNSGTELVIVTAWRKGR
jgi:hypothetical protein